MNFVVLSLGSNCVEREKKMSHCIRWLFDLLSDVKVSSIYETSALNGVDNNYLNAVLSGYTQYDHNVLNKKFKQYEIDCGRDKDNKIVGIVPIDVDIVMWNDKIIRNNDYMQAYFQIGWNEINGLVYEKDE